MASASPASDRTGRSRRAEPRPESSYALSKLVGETLATQFSRRSGIPFVGLRISNIMEPDDYAEFPTYWADARLRRWNLCGLRRLPRRRAGVPPRARGECQRGSRVHHRRGRYRDDPSFRGSHGRGLPRRAAHPSRRGPRDAAGDRPGADAPGIRPGASVVGPRGVPRVAAVGRASTAVHWSEPPGDRCARVRRVGTERAGSDGGIEVRAQPVTVLADPRQRRADRPGDADPGTLGR